MISNPIFARAIFSCGLGFNCCLQLAKQKVFFFQYDVDLVAGPFPFLRHVVHGVLFRWMKFEDFTIFFQYMVSIASGGDL